MDYFAEKIESRNLYLYDATFQSSTSLVKRCYCYNGANTTSRLDTDLYEASNKARFSTTEN